MFCFDSEVGDILIIRGVLFIPSKVYFPCLYLEIYAFSALKSLWRLPCVFFWCVRSFYFVLVIVYFFVLLSVHVVSCDRVFLDLWRLQCTVHYCESAPFVQWKIGERQTFCVVLYGRWHTQLLRDRFCLSTVLATFYANKVLSRILEFSRPLTDQSSACVLH